VATDKGLNYGKDHTRGVSSGFVSVICRRRACRFNFMADDNGTRYGEIHFHWEMNGITEDHKKGSIIIGRV
jgi:hypothetical protein